MSPDFGTNPGQAERAAQDWAAGLQQKAAKFAAMRQRIDAVRVTESSPAVTVTVNSEGVPVEVRFAERAVSGAQLSQEFMAVLRRAQSKIADHVAEATGDTIGEQPTSGTVVDAYRKRFAQPAGHPHPGPPEAPPTGSVAPHTGLPPARPGPPPDSTPASKPASTQPHTGHDDGDFSDETFLH